MKKTLTPFGQAFLLTQGAYATQYLSMLWSQS